MTLLDRTETGRMTLLYQAWFGITTKRYNSWGETAAREGARKGERMTELEQGKGVIPVTVWYDYI